MQRIETPATNYADQRLDLLKTGHLAETKHDFEALLKVAEAIKELAVIHKRQHDFDKAFYFLLKAAECKPDTISLRSAEAQQYLVNFFTGFEIITSPFIFDLKHVALLNALSKTSTIKTVTFGKSFSASLVTGMLGSFLRQTKSVTSLDLSTSEIHTHKLQPHQMIHLRDGLRMNTSLESIELENQPIGDSGLTYLIAGLTQKDNKAHPLKFMNLRNTQITTQGANLLIQFLEKFSTLEFVDLSNNADISAEAINTINTLTSKHFQANNVTLSSTATINLSLPIAPILIPEQSFSFNVEQKEVVNDALKNLQVAIPEKRISPNIINPDDENEEKNSEKKTILNELKWENINKQESPKPSA